MADEFREAVEVIPGRYAVCFVKHADAVKYSAVAAGGISYSIDDELLYEPFYADFGPLNLGKTYRFCEHTKQLLQEAEKRGKKLYLYAGPSPQAKANAAVLVGIFQVLYLGRSPDEAHAPLAAQGPYMPFRDASCGIPTFNLQPIDCIRGIAKARDCGFIDASGGSWRFDLAEYEHYEQVENGDLNWILPGKLLAFSGPAARPTDYVGFRAMTPEDYWDYFKTKDVAAIVRLNKKVYDARRFTSGGFQHHELYFPDGSCPSQDILLSFLDLAEQTPGCLAIHCKAGLGRTGVLICSYLMKHYRFTAEEVIGYIRVARPGSVIGPQQGFIRDIQRIMWLEGDAYRATHGPHPPPLMWGVTPAAARIAAAAAAAKAAAVSRAGSIVVDATGDSSSRGSSVDLEAAAVPAGRVAALAQSFDKSASDMSLRQMKDRLTGSSSSGNSGSSGTSGSSGRIVRSNSSGCRAVKSGVAPQQLFGSGSSGGGGGGPLTSGLICRPSTSQSLLLRPTSAAAGHAAGSGSSNGSSGASAAAAAGTGLSMYRSTTRSASLQHGKERAAGLSSSYGAAAAASSLNASREAALGTLLSSSIASLRATLHTDRVTSASRPKVALDGAAVSQSSDFIESGWRTPLSGGTSRPQSGVARVLAPNGQPRKVPAAALASLMTPPAAVTIGRDGSSSKTGLTPGTPQQQQQQQAGRLSAYYST